MARNLLAYPIQFFRSFSFMFSSKYVRYIQSNVLESYFVQSLDTSCSNSYAHKPWIQVIYMIQRARVQATTFESMSETQVRGFWRPALPIVGARWHSGWRSYDRGTTAERGKNQKLKPSKEARRVRFGWTTYAHRCPTANEPRDMSTRGFSSSLPN